MARKKVNKKNKGKVIGIISCKSGVGKSLVSINVVKQLLNLVEKRPLLVDMSKPFGGSHGFLPEYDVSWATIMPLLTSKVDNKKLATVISDTDLGFDYLASPTEMGVQKLSKKQFQVLIDSLREYTDIIVLDMPSISSKEDIEKIDTLDEIVCLVTPEPSVLFSTKKIYSQNDISSKKWKYVLNRLDREGSPRLKEQIEKKLRLSFVSSIEDDPDAVWKHYFSSSLITREDLVLTQDFKDLAEILVNK